MTDIIVPPRTAQRQHAILLLQEDLAQVFKDCARPECFHLRRMRGLCEEILAEERLKVKSSAAALPSQLATRAKFTATSTTTSSVRTPRSAPWRWRYNHYKRIHDIDNPVLTSRILSATAGEQVELGKSNILMLGPTGCGKPTWRQPWRRSWMCPSPWSTQPPHRGGLRG